MILPTKIKSALHFLVDVDKFILCKYPVMYCTCTCRCQVEELQEVAAELEREKENLLRRVSQRDKQIDSLKEQASANQKQLTELQNRLAKVWAISNQLRSMIFIVQRYIRLETINMYL